MKIHTVATHTPSSLNKAPASPTLASEPQDRLQSRPSDPPLSNVREFLEFGARAAAITAVPSGLAVAAFKAGAEGGALGVLAGLIAVPCFGALMLPHIFSGGNNKLINNATAAGAMFAVAGSVALGAAL